MILQLIEKDDIQTNEERESWFNDPQIKEYVELRDAGSIGKDEIETSLTNFNRYYEIYNNNRHVGDIKTFYETEDDIFNKHVQILMVVGNRNQGIGTQALKLLIDKLKDSYNTVYCIIQRKNIASLKILKRNKFQVEKLDNDTIRLSRNL